jgi:hypothetical protein
MNLQIDYEYSRQDVLNFVPNASSGKLESHPSPRCRTNPPADVVAILGLDLCGDVFPTLTNTSL